MSFYVIIRGPLGCGKSTIAKEIAKKLKAEYINIDRILDEHHLTSEWEEGYMDNSVGYMTFTPNYPSDNSVYFIIYLTELSISPRKAF